MEKDYYHGWNDGDEKLEGIKNCPFCGGHGELLSNGYERPEIDPETGAYIGMDIFDGDILWCQCENCGAMAEDSDTPEGAISNWNRRVKENNEE